MMTDLLPKVNSLVPEFVSSIARPFSENDMLSNSRGDHWFSIAGHDRNNKSVSFHHRAAAPFAPLTRFALLTLGARRNSVPEAESLRHCEVFCQGFRFREAYVGGFCFLKTFANHPLGHMVAAS